ncbi:glutathione S-transferase family protein [Pseudaminobacter sp. 19-2017]|uniref:Glutathione S-transferase family protein n=1 Tax=Pseudaminobacter soli (ex Zhang et al. 2022) TaxID=2831468 RepID=A0A942DVZ8_9HYPH|nr:glutathione S-transferase family protein [Pseudaminobacter soli]MBS3648194.1 glutathione S-transferase family protein [Pseudaminobacter soli]
MIKVWGRDTSSNVQIVVWALTELRVPYERIDAGGKFGRTDTEEYRRMNPNRLVPVLQEGDLTLFESAAIVRYLGARYGGEQFWPSDPARRAPLDMWAEWIKTTFGPALLTGLFWPLVGVPVEKRDLAAIAAAEQRMEGLAAILDERLAKVDPYLGGESICFADILVGTLLYRYFTLDFERADTPHLSAYYDRLTTRPAYAQRVMISYESLRAK